MTTTQRTEGQIHSADRRTPRRSAGRQRMWRAILTCVGLLAAAFAASSQAQVNRAGRKVSGVVVAAATQQPVANARVSYEEAGRPLQTAVTDSKGAFELPEGNVGVVTVTARRFGTARRRWPPRSGSQLRIALVPPAIVTGSVTDRATGRLLPSVVTVTVQHPENFVSETAGAPRGTFRIEDLPPGPAAVLARSEGFAPFIGSIVVEGGKEREARIGLLLEVQAAGKVVDAAGEPVTGAFVNARYPRLPGGRRLETTRRQSIPSSTPATGIPRYQARTARPSMPRILLKATTARHAEAKAPSLPSAATT